eukprot:ctg_765.g299
MCRTNGTGNAFLILPPRSREGTGGRSNLYLNRSPRSLQCPGVSNASHSDWSGHTIYVAGLPLPRRTRICRPRSVTFEGAADPIPCTFVHRPVDACLSLLAMTTAVLNATAFIAPLRRPAPIASGRRPRVRGASDRGAVYTVVGKSERPPPVAASLTARVLRWSKRLAPLRAWLTALRQRLGVGVLGPGGLNGTAVQANGAVATLVDTGNAVGAVFQREREQLAAELERLGAVRVAARVRAGAWRVTLPPRTEWQEALPLLELHDFTGGRDPARLGGARPDRSGQGAPNTGLATTGDPRMAAARGAAGGHRNGIAQCRATRRPRFHPHRTATSWRPPDAGGTHSGVAFVLHGRPATRVRLCCRALLFRLVRASGALDSIAQRRARLTAATAVPVRLGGRVSAAADREDRARLSGHLPLSARAVGGGVRLFADRSRSGEARACGGGAAQLPALRCLAAGATDASSGALLAGAWAEPRRRRQVRARFSVAVGARRGGASSAGGIVPAAERHSRGVAGRALLPADTVHGSGARAAAEVGVCQVPPGSESARPAAFPLAAVLLVGGADRTAAAVSDAEGREPATPEHALRHRPLRGAVLRGGGRGGAQRLRTVSGARRVPGTPRRPPADRLTLRGCAGARCVKSVHAAAQVDAEFPRR